MLNSFHADEFPSYEIKINYESIESNVPETLLFGRHKQNIKTQGAVCNDVILVMVYESIIWCKINALDIIMQ